MKNIENSFPQGISKKELVELGAIPLDMTTYLRLDLENKRGIYEPDYGKKDENGKYTDFVLRNVIDLKKMN